MASLIVVMLDTGAGDQGPGTVVGIVATIGEWLARNPRADPRTRFWPAGRFRPGDRVQLMGTLVRSVDQVADRDRWRSFARERERIEGRRTLAMFAAVPLPAIDPLDLDTVMMRSVP